MNTIEILHDLGACSESIEWVESQPDQSPDALWRACTNVDWLAWYLERVATHNGIGSHAHRLFVSVACLCVRTIIPLWHDQTFELALADTERWALDHNIRHHPAHHALNARYVRPRTYAQAILADHRFPAAVAYAVSSPNHPQSATFAISALNDLPPRILASLSLSPSPLADLIRSAIPSPPFPSHSSFRSRSF